MCEKRAQLQHCHLEANFRCVPVCHCRMLDCTIYRTTSWMVYKAKSPTLISLPFTWLRCSFVWKDLDSWELTPGIHDKNKWDDYPEAVHEDKVKPEVDGMSMLTVNVAISVFSVKVEYVPIKLTYVKHVVTAFISIFDVMTFTSYRNTAGFKSTMQQ